MMLLIGAVAVVVVAYVIWRLRSLGHRRRDDFGSMSEQWLAEHHASRSA